MLAAMQKLSASLLLLLVLIPAALAQSRVTAVKVESLLDLNAILITEVDVIFVYDPALQLPETKSDWYSEREAFITANADRLDVVTLSAPQGFVERNLVLPERHGEAVKVLVTACHFCGASRLRCYSARTWLRMLSQAFCIQIGDL